MMASSRVREADWCVTLESTRAVARPRFPGPVIPEPPTGTIWSGRSMRQTHGRS
jgi:hypothetical protein